MQVRNRGTIGGSIAHADPAADYPAALVALDAEIIATSRSGQRTIKATEFFTGLFSTALNDGELITEIRVPATSGSGTAYCKFHHPASGFAVVGVAAVVRANGNRIESAAIGITGAADHAYRATGVQDAVRGKSLNDIHVLRMLSPLCIQFRHRTSCPHPEIPPSMVRNMGGRL